MTPNARHWLLIDFLKSHEGRTVKIIAEDGNEVLVRCKENGPIQVRRLLCWTPCPNIHVILGQNFIVNFVSKEDLNNNSDGFKKENSLNMNTLNFRTPFNNIFKAEFNLKNDKCKEVAIETLNKLSHKINGPSDDVLVYWLLHQELVD